MRGSQLGRRQWETGSRLLHMAFRSAALTGSGSMGWRISLSAYAPQTAPFAPQQGTILASTKSDTRRKQAQKPKISKLFKKIAR